MPIHSLSAHQIIADLNWVIFNPSLLNDNVLNEVQLQPLTPKQLNRLEQLGGLELPSSKLGYYFEALVKRYIEVSDAYTLKAANVQVQENRQTLGEFDMLIENEKNNHFEHWEVSCKFYLCHAPQQGLEGCCGTQLKDVFAVKLDRMRDKQLKLSKTPQGIETLQKLRITEPTSKGLLKGMVFYHQSLGASSNNQLNDFHFKGIWMYSSEWHKKPESKFVVLQKPFLFSLHSYQLTAVKTNAEVNDLLKKEMPIMLAEVSTEEEVLIEQKRFWVIPDGWFKN